jgi:hypothetical protein
VATMKKLSYRNSLTFRRNVLPPSPGSKSRQSNRHDLVTTQSPFKDVLSLAGCVVYISTLKMEAAFSSELSVNFYQTTRRPRKLHSSKREICTCSKELGYA